MSVRRKKSSKRWKHRDLTNDICQFSLLIWFDERSENSQVGYENVLERISVALFIIQINNAEIEELDHHLPEKREKIHSENIREKDQCRFSDFLSQERNATRVLRTWRWKIDDAWSYLNERSN